jgi:predicted GNAT superfamily acetyltransferase
MDVTRGQGQLRVGVPGSGPVSDLDVEVRTLESLDEFRACVDLQKAIWGESYVDVVPASILQVTQKVDGVAAGAVLPDGSLAGFVYGISGFRQGRPSHWSHMLGVRGEYRGLGIGRSLKLFQARWLAERGIPEMRWTFDPLVASNANFNLNGLGATVEEYHPDAYGDTGSELHNFGTDRFVVLWMADDAARVEEASWDTREDPEDEPLLPLANAVPPAAAAQSGTGEDGRPDEVPQAPWSGKRVRIQIPDGIYGISRADPGLAEAWRQSTRAAFLEGLGRGFRVSSFVRGPKGGPHHYVLVRDPASGD